MQLRQARCNHLAALYIFYKLKWKYPVFMLQNGHRSVILFLILCEEQSYA